jgi:hypothetical protein
MVVVAFDEKKLAGGWSLYFLLVGSVPRQRRKGTGRIAYRGKLVYLK